jgi:hypothetical protein
MLNSAWGGGTYDPLTSLNVRSRVVWRITQVFSSSDNLIHDSAGGEEASWLGGGGEAQRPQLQPFSIRFKNIVL